jgi:hypothetical protein
MVKLDLDGIMSPRFRHGLRVKESFEEAVEIVKRDYKVQLPVRAATEFYGSPLHQVLQESLGAAATQGQAAHAPPPTGPEGGLPQHQLDAIINAASRAEAQAGAQGPMGPQGPQGVQGSDGPTGPTGAPGGGMDTPMGPPKPKVQTSP